MALRDPHAFAQQTHMKAASSSGNKSGRESSSGLRVLPVFVLSDLAFSSPLSAGEKGSGGAASAVPLAFDHGQLVRVMKNIIIRMEKEACTKISISLFREYMDTSTRMCILQQLLFALLILTFTFDCFV